jgi:hypothetical protein
MRTALNAAALATLLTAIPAYASEAELLYKVCSKFYQYIAAGEGKAVANDDIFDAAMCAGQLTTVWELMRPQHPGCKPSKLDFLDLQNAFMTWMNRHPEAMQLPAPD